MSRDRFAGATGWAVLCLALAIVADLAETLVDPANSDSAAKLYDAAAQQHGRMVGSAVLLLASAAFLVPGVFGLVRAVRERGRRVGNAAAVLAVMGCMGHAALATLYLVWAAIPGGEGAREQLLPVIDRITDSSSFVIVLPLVLAFPLALVTTFVALVRAWILPRWALIPVLGAPVAAASGIGSTSTSTAIALLLLLGTTTVLAARVLGASTPRPGMRGAATASA